MKKTLLTSFCLALVTLVVGQTKMILNDNVYLVIDNAGIVVLENNNTDALTTTGVGGGNIVSENENDIIKWEIGTATGNYVIPWTTASGVQIPLTINKTTTGTGVNGVFVLSTYETATDMNTPYPSGVTNMNSSPPVVDESLAVVDRFWHIDASSYTAKPDITMVMNYNPAANETGGTNTLAVTNLLAQRFNTVLGTWESTLFGTNDFGNNRVAGITVPAADFFEDWILVDINNPLPVELTSFEASCNQGKVDITWSTQTEINNDYFVVEKSDDAIQFFELTTIQGAGNSNVINNYTVTDDNYNTNVVYYRLKQVDFNGEVSYHQIIPVNCFDSKNQVSIYPNPNKGIVNISLGNLKDVEVKVFNTNGKLIHKATNINSSNYQFEITAAKGIYFVALSLGNEVKRFKVIKD